MKDTTLRTLINFRVPIASRKLLSEYAEHHNVTVSFLLRYNLTRLLEEIDADGLPRDLAYKITRYHLNEQIDARVQHLKELRYMAYRKAESIAWLTRGEAIANGSSPESSDVKFNILKEMTDTVIQEHNDTQRKIIILCAEWERTFEEESETRKIERLQKTDDSEI